MIRGPLAAVALLSLLPRTARAEASATYTVRAGDTCPSIARRVYGDAKRYDLLHKNNDLGAPPHRLKPGLVLRTPPLGPDAQLTFLRNRVEAYTPEQHAGRKDEPLSRGNKVGTLASSSAEITFSDQTQMQLGEHSLVVILGGEASKVRGTAADTTLLSGTLRAHLAELASGKAPPVALATPAGRIRLGAGEAQVQVDEKKSTRLSVYRGASRLRASGKEVRVPAGFGSRADQGKAPTAPRPLPPSPEWTTRPPRLVLLLAGTAEASGSYRASRAAGPKAAKFHVQLARDEKFNDLIVDARVPAETTELVARGLAAGDYHARIAAIDNDDFEGPASPPVQVTVAELVVKEAAGRVTLSQPAGLRCSIDGAAEQVGPAERELLPAVPHALRCSLDGNGEAVAQAELQARGQAPPPPVLAMPAPPPKAVAPRAAPAPRAKAPPPSWLLEPALLVGTIIDGRTAAAGLHLGAEASVRAPLPRGGLAFGARLQYEYIPYRIALRAPCPFGSCNEMGSVTTTSRLRFRHVLGLGVPVAYRFPAVEQRLIFSAGLLPELIADFATTEQGTLQRLGFAIGALLSMQLKLFRGGPFVEIGYRYVLLRPDAGDESTLSGLLLDGGYRFSF